MPSHVLILGCGRSGTSIFGELFEDLPGYTYYSEPEFSTVVGLSFDQSIAIKVPKESDGYVASHGLSFPIDVMMSTLPEPRVIYWQVRHPLDAVASLRIGIANNWGHHPRPPDWQNWLTRSLVEKCAYHWAFLNTDGYEQVRSQVKVCRFETMIKDPTEFARQICADVGINPDLCQANVDDWSRRVQDSNNEHFIEAKTSRRYSRADHKNRVGRWRENLTDDDVRQIVPIVREAASAFSYDLPNA